MMDELEKRIEENFAAQGLMNTLGARISRIAPGEVQIVLDHRPELSQQHGYTHAGALTSVLDSACGYAALTLAPPGMDVLSVEFKINFLRPAVAERFVATGRVIKAGRTLTVCAGDVVGEHPEGDRTIAVMQATIINVPGETHAN
ncbi:MAG: PaaI family thioesterase [Xanthomonadales bacterium]|nr:PaaI family thioesterase [Xanthomonadales bacterium]